MKILMRFLSAVLLICVVFLAIIFAHFRGNARFPVDCAIVFGTAVRLVPGERGAAASVTAGPGILRRVKTAADLYKKGNVKHIFLSGGRGEGMPESEAEVMRQIALSSGIADRDIVIEDRSTSTKENLLFTRNLTSDCQSTVAISDRYHLARIELLALLQGWVLQTYPASPHADLAFEVQSVLREMVGMAAAFAGR